jgi:oligosaccharide reducing-end xylanase
VITARVGTGANWGTWETFQKLHQQGHDVQSHTTTHFNPAVPGSQETEDLYKDSIPALEQGVPGLRVRTLAYPGGPNAKNDPAIAAKYYTAVRGTRGLLNAANTVNYIDTNSVGNGLPSDGKNWATVQFLTDPKHKFFRGWGCMHFHGLENPKEPAKAAKINAVKIMDYLKEHEADIWVGTFTEVTCYGQERDTAKLTSKLEGKTVKLSITDDMDDKLFDTPLTVKVRLDPAWTKVTASQGSKDLQVQLIEKNGAKFALVPVVPDKGDVVVTAE